MSNLEQLAAEEVRFSSNGWVAPEVQEAGRWPHQKAGQVVRLMAWLSTLGTVVTGVAIIMPTLATSHDGLPVDLLLLFACGAVIAASLFFVARGLMQGRGWARIAGILCGILALAGFPLGTVVGCYVLWQLVVRCHQARLGAQMSTGCPGPPAHAAPAAGTEF